MKLLKLTFKILSVLLLSAALILGSIIASSISLSKELQFESVEETKERFGNFKEGEIIKKEKVGFIKHLVLSTAGLFIKRYKALEKVNIYSIAYKSDGLIVTGIMLTPKKAGNFPCIIYNRGGNRDAGRLSFNQLNKFMAPYAAEGYVVIASNYRGNSGSEGKEEFGGADVSDILNLIPALSQVEKADTSRVGVLGHSRGGMMTYKALQNKEVFKAAAVIAGSANLYKTISLRPDMEKYVYAEIIPAFYENRDELIKDRSVVYWPEKLSATPLLILHGTGDKRVSYDVADELSNKLDSLNFPYKFITFTGDNHVLDKNRFEAQSQIMDWFNKYLRDLKPYSESEKRVTYP
ncbi:alpha/beta hydrolase family protein [Chondrinema litorale]|uniref:alpha/beta hydrolase family protein n=1 Tax=Chondrinema litorale TaxID=2994555 RepID=UPI00254337B9|nr:prolyl oligopeptidase family serine peptidase [Chondrinema litorale]UZR96539.1 prolyl oligopeptidase family serine peptidase [Chondrinema litorale]